MEPHRARIRELMEAKGYASEFIEQIFEQIKGFGSYGFPQSHAASFAKLVYVSCWLKRHEPAAFACALLNSQPMGFYSPSQIVQDARRGREARACGRIPAGGRDLQRLRQHAGGRHAAGDSSKTRRGRTAGDTPGIARRSADCPKDSAAPSWPRAQRRPFHDIADLCLRANLDEKARNALAEAGALQSLAGNRHQARWIVAGIERQHPLLPGSPRRAADRAAGAGHGRGNAVRLPRARPDAAGGIRCRCCATSCARGAAWVRANCSDKRHGSIRACRRAGDATASARRPPAAPSSSPWKTSTAWSTWWSGRTWPSAGARQLLGAGCWRCDGRWETGRRREPI